MNILFKNIIYANRLYVACCLYSHNIPPFFSRVICLIWTHRLTSYSKLIFTYNTRNAGSKSYLHFCFQLFSLFLQNTYNSIHFNSGKNLTSLLKLQSPFWTAAFCSGNKSVQFLFPHFAKKNYMHIHIKKSLCVATVWYAWETDILWECKLHKTEETLGRNEAGRTNNVLSMTSMIQHSKQLSFSILH
jgi:hypothetical protein